MLCLQKMDFLRKKKNKKQDNNNNTNKETENGGLLLEELIASSDGKYNPLRSYSSDQILKATKHFDMSYVVSVDRFVWYGGTIEDRFVWYKGMLEDRNVLIKKWKMNESVSDNIYRDIAVSSLMSNQKNVLKVLGYCLEFDQPVLVCESADKGALTLDACVGKDPKPLPWSIRLNIAEEVASAIAYLHTALPKTTIHRDIKPGNIFLDENWRAKLSSFCLSISIPEGESCAYDDDPILFGVSTFGADPDYSRTGVVTENLDVYSFGMTMLALLTGKYGVTWTNNGRYIPLPGYVGKLMAKGKLSEVIDLSMLDSDGEISEHQRLQMEAFAKLALRCVRFNQAEVVPKMVNVAKELTEIESM